MRRTPRERARRGPSPSLPVAAISGRHVLHALAALGAVRKREVVVTHDFADIARRAALEAVATEHDDPRMTYGRVELLLVLGEQRPVLSLQPERVAGHANSGVATRLC